MKSSASWKFFGFVLCLWSTLAWGMGAGCSVGEVAGDGANGDGGSYNAGTNAANSGNVGSNATNGTNTGANANQAGNAGSNATNGTNTGANGTPDGGGNGGHGGTPEKGTNTNSADANGASNHGNPDEGSGDGGNNSGTNAGNNAGTNSSNAGNKADGGTGSGEGTGEEGNGADAGGGESVPEKPVTPDRNGIVLPNPPPPVKPPAGSFQPEIMNVSVFWRFMPGSVFRPIVPTAKIWLKNTGNATVTNLKVDVKLYMTRGIQTKYIPFDVASPTAPSSIPKGYSKIHTFTGQTMDHGLPKYSSPKEICNVIYIPVLRFRYEEGGKAKEFSLMWRQVPFGCTCHGSQSCP